MKRFMPRAMGRASKINKRSSHVLLVLKEKGATTEKKAKAEKVKTPAKSTPKAKKVVTKAKKPAKKEAKS